MDITIRPEMESEFPAIYKLIKTAFKTAKVSDGDEQDYVNVLRRSAAYIPDLALVAVHGEELIGHILLTATFLDMPTGRLRVLLLSPLCVKLEYRRKGIGGQLIRAGLTKAGSMGFKAVFLVGDPGYYSRFGFVEAGKMGIVNRGNVPAQFVLGIELEKGALGYFGGSIGIQ